jgi:branched-chain amino acid transport system substrate-binding protein
VTLHAIKTLAAGLLTDVPALGLAHAHDLLFTDSFYWDRTPETRAIGNEFFKRHGAMPTAYQAGVNSSLRWRRPTRSTPRP